MADVYDDLNNYEDVNAVDELRNENKELKVKLEQHAAAMEKLQKDYDTLEMEFKKLENNYSSLLKTARSEVERKSQRITQLNLEKDMMIIEALKNGKNIRRNFNKGVQNLNKVNNEKPNKKNENRNKESDVKQKNWNEGCETTAYHTKDQITDTNNRNKFEYAGAKEEVLRKRDSNVIHKKTELDETPKIQANSIRDRRKSMPAASMPIDQFSSDEEHKQNHHAKDTRPDRPPLDKFDRRNSNKVSVDRHSNKTSETFNIDDRGNNYYESSSRDNYKSRPSRNSESGSYRGRDKYDGAMKSKKQYSPDRGVKRQYREHQNQERGRYQGRSLESPPPESYNRHLRRNPEPQSSDSRHYHDHDKYKHRYDDKYQSKSKSSVDYDEPQNKRQRIESFGKPHPQSREDRRYVGYYHEKEPMEVHRNPGFSPHEYEMNRYSCQSPEFLHTDAASTEPIEIKTATTTSTPIQDPRLTDSRYVLKQENGKETISTRVGRNIDLMSVDKSKWNITPVEIPSTLVHRPSEYKDEMIKDIYMDIDSPNSEAYSAMEPISNNSYDVPYNVCNENLHGSKDLTLSKEQTDIMPQQTTDTTLEASQHNISKYRIPKVGQEKISTRSKMDVPIIDLGVSESQKTNIYKKVATETDVQEESLLSKQPRDRHDNLHEINKNSDTMEGKVECQNQEAKMAIVADDLELSDDNSDHLDINRQSVPEKDQKSSKTKPDIGEVRCVDSVHKIEKDSSKTSQSGDSVELNKREEVKNKEAECTKKQKSKKRKSKSKEISKDFTENTDAITETSHVSEKKVKSKKEKESKSKETKETFSALFGDSSSLMTPEDLGIPTYVPISEDAQIAVDMKINQIIDATPLDKELPVVIQKENTVEITKQATTTHEDKPTDVPQNCKVKDNEVFKEIKTKKASKKKEQIIDPNEFPSLVYENMNPGTDSNEPPDVVKTVVISTGKQPEIAFENRELIATPTTDVVVNKEESTSEKSQVPAIKEFKRLDMLKALATSTPQKDFPSLNPIETDIINNDVCNSDKPVERGVKENGANTLQTQDAPDVRIFVKRRRKLAKRSPMT